MEHKKFIKKISEFMDDGLKGAELNEFKAHMKECASCLKELNRAQKAVKKLSVSKKHKVPLNFYKNLNKKLDAVDEKKENRAFMPSFGRRFAYGGAATAFALLLAFFFVTAIVKNAKEYGFDISGAKGQMPNAKIRQKAELPKEEKLLLSADKLNAKGQMPNAKEDQGSGIRDQEKKQPGARGQRLGTQEGRRIMAKAKAPVAGKKAKAVTGSQITDIKSQIKQKPGSAAVSMAEAPAVARARMSMAGSESQITDKRSQVKQKPEPFGVLEAPAAAMAEADMSAAESQITDPRPQIKQKSVPETEDAYAPDVKEYYGSADNVKRFSTIVLRDGDELQNARANGIYIPLTPDFSKEMIVGVFGGQKPNAGYIVKILSWSVKNGRIAVKYTDKQAVGGVHAQVIRYPYHLKIIPRSDLPVIFEKE